VSQLSIEGENYFDEIPLRKGIMFWFGEFYIRVQFSHTVGALILFQSASIYLCFSISSLRVQGFYSLDDDVRRIILVSHYEADIKETVS
jgi:hypothetical protein